MSEQQNAWLQALLDQQKALLEHWSSLSASSGLNPETGMFNPQHFSANIQQQLDQLASLGEQFTQQQTASPHQMEWFKSALALFSQQTLADQLAAWKIPDELLQALQNQLHSQPLDAHFQKLASTPFFASTEQLDWQQRSQRGLNHLEAYQQALADYFEIYQQISEQASAQLLQQLNNGELQIDSLSELHRHWSNTYDAVYADVISTPNYSQKHGAISNQINQLIAFTNETRDQHIQALGFVSQTELDQVMQRQHKLRKEVRTVKRNQASSDQAALIGLIGDMQATLSSMAAEIDTLKHEVKTLKAALESKEQDSERP